MARPKVDRVSRHLRLPAELDAALVAASESTGRSINREAEVRLAAGLKIAAPVDTQAGTDQAQARRAGEPPRGARAPEPRTGCEHGRLLESDKGWGIICDPAKGGCGAKLR
jgi:hypothetical protein